MTVKDECCDAVRHYLDYFPQLTPFVFEEDYGRLMQHKVCGGSLERYLTNRLMCLKMSTTMPEEP